MLSRVFVKPKSPEISESTLEELRGLCERIAMALRHCGVKTIPYRDSSTPLLRAAEPQSLERVPEFILYAQLLEDFIAQGEDPFDSKRLLWRALGVLGLTSQADILDQIRSDEVVEIYDWQNRQVFRNLRFFDFASCTIEEMMTVDWTKATRRELPMTFKLFKFVALMKTGQIKETYNLTDIGEHLVHERLGELRTWYMAFQHYAPVRQKGAPFGFLVTSRCRWPIQL